MNNLTLHFKDLEKGEQAQVIRENKIIKATEEINKVKNRKAI